MTPLVVVLLFVVFVMWQRRRVAAVCRRLWSVFVPVPTVPADDVLDADDPFALIRRIAARLTLAESFNRTLKRLVFVLIGVLAVVAILIIAFVVDSRHRDDQRERDRIERTIASCQQDRVTRAQINAGDDAKDALADATDAVQNEIDLVLEPLRNAPDEALTADQRALRDRYIGGKTTVADKLKVAHDKIDQARVADRDCTPEGIGRYFSTTTTTPGG